MAGCTGWSGDCPPASRICTKRPVCRAADWIAVDQVVRGQVIRARAGHQQSIAVHEAQRQLVQLAVGRLSLGYVLFALDERGRVDNHDIEALSPLLQRFQGVKSIVTRGLDADAVGLRIAACSLQRGVG